MLREAEQTRKGRGRGTDRTGYDSADCVGARDGSRILLLQSECALRVSLHMFAPTVLAINTKPAQRQLIGQ